MITSEIKVNGNLIGHIKCVNMSKMNKKDEHLYNVAFYDTNTEIIRQFDIWHMRAEGYERLMFKIWSCINEKT